MLHLTGYEKPTMEDLKQFRQFGSVTAGHPENFLLEAVEVSTGPLGQGISNAVGMAIAETHLAAVFNKPGYEIINNYTYVICGDGCLQEGVSSEASSLAGHLKLGKLIVLYDDNKITIDGSTELSFTEDVAKRYEAYGWQVLSVADGNNDFAGIESAVREAQQCADKPTIIKVTTEIGFGSSKAGTAGVHGSPLGEDGLKDAKVFFGFDPEKKFSVPEKVLDYYRMAIDRGEQLSANWNDSFASYKKGFPEAAAELERRINRKLPAQWNESIPSWKPADKALASRESSATVLNLVAEAVPELIGGSADLTPSNKTSLKGSHDFQAATPDGRYFRFGIREHGMAAICNGMAAYGGIIPYCASFLNFAGYALGSIRLSALSRFQVLYVMTHDSIGLGEDGPTHQPIEMLLSLRSMPNMYVFRPADANEVAGAYEQAMSLRNSPSLFSLSRQGLPNLVGSSAKSVAMGAYTLNGASGNKSDLILASTGSEVNICVAAADVLSKAGINTAVVSMPCWKLFDQQDKGYKESVFPEGVPVLSVEAATTHGWSKYSHMQIGIDRFGKSAPAKKLYEYFGITTDSIAKNGKALVEHYKGAPVPWLINSLTPV